MRGQLCCYISAQTAISTMPSSYSLVLISERRATEHRLRGRCVKHSYLTGRTADKTSGTKFTVCMRIPYEIAGCEFMLQLGFLHLVTHLVVLYNSSMPCRFNSYIEIATLVRWSLNFPCVVISILSIRLISRICPKFFFSALSHRNVHGTSWSKIITDGESVCIAIMYADQAATVQQLLWSKHLSSAPPVLPGDISEKRVNR